MTDFEAQQTGWERGWEGHQRAQSLRLARLSLSEKLEWLEQAQRLADQLAAARKNSSDRKQEPSI